MNIDQLQICEKKKLTSTKIILPSFSMRKKTRGGKERKEKNTKMEYGSNYQADLNLQITVSLRISKISIS